MSQAATVYERPQTNICHAFRDCDARQAAAVGKCFSTDSDHCNTVNFRGDVCSSYAFIAIVNFTDRFIKIYISTLNRIGYLTSGRFRGIYPIPGRCGIAVPGRRCPALLSVDIVERNIISFLCILIKHCECRLSDFWSLSHKAYHLQATAISKCCSTDATHAIWD